MRTCASAPWLPKVLMCLEPTKHTLSTPKAVQHRDIVPTLCFFPMLNTITWHCVRDVEGSISLNGVQQRNRTTQQRSIFRHCYVHVICVQQEAKEPRIYHKAIIKYGVACSDWLMHDASFLQSELNNQILWIQGYLSSHVTTYGRFTGLAAHTIVKDGYHPVS